MHINPALTPDKSSSHYLKIKEILSGFEIVTLAQMESVMLFDRVDTKFLFPMHKLPDIILAMREDYYTLEVKQTRVHTYHTLYYDTKDFVHYLRHHNQMKSRFKFRHRIYMESDLHFFEIKEKTNKERTLKSRVMITEKAVEITPSASALISQHTPYKAEDLVPKLWSNFHRITMVHKSRQERLTIDINILFANEEKCMQTPASVILELKQEKMNYAIPFMRLLISKGIRPSSISKYTMGVANLYDGIKKNNFKPNQSIINKISKLK